MSSDLTLVLSLVRRHAGAIAIALSFLGALGFSYVTPRAEINAIRQKQAAQDSALREMQRDVKSLVKVACFALSQEDIVKLDLTCRNVGR